MKYSECVKFDLNLLVILLVDIHVGSFVYFFQKEYI